jgi:hypothetical protein
MIPNVEFVNQSNKQTPQEEHKIYEGVLIGEPEIYEPVTYLPIPITSTNEYETDSDIEFNNSSTFLDVIRQRIKYVFEPLFSSSTSQKFKSSVKYKPRLKVRNKTLYKPEFYNRYFTDYDYEPSYTNVNLEDFSPKERNEIRFKPHVHQESYPTFTYSTLGLPDTFVDNYAPEDVVRIKPVTDFEINARPKPLIVSQAHLILLDKLLREVL